MAKMRCCACCGKKYTATGPNNKYCSLECRKAARQLRDKGKLSQRADGSRRVSIDDVLRFAADYERRTGRYPYYGEAVVLMEKERSGKR